MALANQNTTAYDTKLYDTVGKRLAEQIERTNRRAKVVHSTAVNERVKETWSETRVASELKKNNNLARFSDHWNL